MPTTRPRYQITDTGHVSRLLDQAAAAWPEHAGDRKTLLLRLAEQGAHHLSPVPDDLDAEIREHVGKWLALRDGQILTVQDDVSAVALWLRANGERADRTFRVLASEDEVVSEHGLSPE